VDIPSDFHIGSVKSLEPTKSKGKMKLQQMIFLQIMAATMKKCLLWPGGSEGGGGSGETDQLTQLATFNMLINYLQKFGRK